MTIRYAGTLRRGGRFDGGTESIDLGRGEAVAVLGCGIEGIRVGGRRRITVGPQLACGEAGVPGVIPPNAVTIYESELFEVGPSPRTTP